MAERWRRWLVALALAVIGLAATEARAHSLNLFATAAGNTLEGRVYFSGGGAAIDVPILVLGPDGTTIARTTAAADGHFSIPISQRLDYRLIAETADGHRAEFLIMADELPATLPAPAARADNAPALTVPAAAASALDPMLEGDRLPAMIETAVARQVAPLRQQIAAYQTEVRWHDVLGGIGYILGLTGIAAFLLARRQKRSGGG